MQSHMAHVHTNRGISDKDFHADVASYILYLITKFDVIHQLE